MLGMQVMPDAIDRHGHGSETTNEGSGQGSPRSGQVGEPNRVVIDRERGIHVRHETEPTVSKHSFHIRAPKRSERTNGHSIHSPVAQEPHVVPKPEVQTQNGAEARGQAFRSGADVEAVRGEVEVAAAPVERDARRRVARVAVQPGLHVEHLCAWDGAVQLVHRARGPVDEGRARVDDRVTRRGGLSGIQSQVSAQREGILQGGSYGAVEDHGPIGDLPEQGAVDGVSLEVPSEQSRVRPAEEEVGRRVRELHREAALRHRALRFGIVKPWRVVEVRGVREGEAEEAVQALGNEGRRDPVYRGEELVRHVNARNRDVVGEDGAGDS